MSYFSVEINEENIRSIDIESIIGDNPATIEVQNYNNIIVDTSNTLSLTPLEVVEVLNTRIVDFLEAGSGINFDINGDSFTINSSTLPHLHSTNDIVGLSSYVINNAPVRNILASSGVVVQNNSGIFSIALSNPTLQSSNISDFNQSVSGLLPVKGLLSGSGISITNNNNVFTVAVTGNFGLTSEQVDDRVSQLLQAGSNIILSYNDDLNKLEISTSGLQPSGNYSIVGHNHNISDINNLQLILDLKQPSGDYSLVGHSHIPKDVFSNINWTGDYNNFVTYSPGSAVRFNGEVWVMHTFIGAAGYVPNITHWTKIGELTNSSAQINDFESAVSGYAPVKSVAGKYGIVTLNKSDVGLSNVDDTSDLNKPISTSVQIALDTKQPSGNYSLVGHSHSSSDISNFNTSVSGLINGIYAPLNSPNLTGIPTAPTASFGTNNTQIANTQFVRNEISNLVNAAPSTLDTLNELATALGNDPSFATTISNSLGQKANLSGASFSGAVTAPSGNFSVLQQSGINVSVSGHQHSYTDITNFASGIDQTVSTLLVAGNYISVNYDTVADTLTINATGLQPSGNYSTVGHSHVSSDITNFNSSVSGLLPVTNITGGTNVNVSSSGSVFTVSATGLQPSGNYSLVGHSHTSSDITNFNSSVSGLINGIYAPLNSPTLTGIPLAPTAASGTNTNQIANTQFVRNEISNLINSAPATLDTLNELATALGNDANFSTTVANSLAQKANLSGANFTGAVTAPTGNFVFLQQSGVSVSVSGHTHTSSSITDFSASVSGLLPVTNIVGGTNISVVPSGTSYTVSVSGQLGLTAEEVDDRVSNLLVGGSGISLNYDDNANTLSISVSGLSNTINIGDGSGIPLSFTTSETLNIVGSGSTSVGYNNTTKTINISSPSLVRDYELLSTTKSSFPVNGGYAVNNLDVYHNGIKLLVGEDYTATNGSSFVLANPAISGDVVEWQAYATVPRHQILLGEVRSDYVGSTNYIGTSVAGSSESGNVWRIKKYVISDNGVDITSTTAVNVAWNNRLTATYI